MSSHRTECLSYARFRAEEDALPNTPSNEEIDEAAHELLAVGDVSCICPTVPA